MINRILCSLCFYIVFLANAFGLTHVSYINGAETNEIAATAQQILFKKTMVQNGVSGNIDWPDITIGQPFTESFVITACQAFVAKEAFPTPNSIPSSDSYYYYFEKLGKIYKDKNDGCLLNGPFKSQLISRTEGLAAKIKKLLSNGNKLVLVPYSQGNFYVEAALGLLYVRGDLKNFNSIRVVNIGNSAPTSLNGFNMTSTGDAIVDGFPYHFPAVYVPCYGVCGAPATGNERDLHDPIGHFLTLTYLDVNTKSFQTKTSFPSIIADLVKRAISELNSDNYVVSPLVAQISKDIIFTVNGPNLTSGMGFSVDDCAPTSNELPGGTSTQRQFRCTINSVPGTKNGVLKNRPDGTELLRFTVNATNSTSNKWLSTITPPGYVVKQFIFTDLSSLPDGAFNTSGEYRINFDSISCNLTQVLAISGTRSNTQIDFDVTYTSPITLCSDGSHTATQGYKESYTGVLSAGVLFVTPKSACSFSLSNKCYNFETFSPTP